MRPVSSQEVERALAALDGFDFGKSTEALEIVDGYVRKSHDQLEMKKWLEEGLVKKLQPGSSYALKKYACQQLWILGEDQAVPALSALFASEDVHLVEAACYAISCTPSMAADAAVSQALDRANGRPRLALIQLAGDRRDPRNVSRLAHLAADPDGACAEAAATALGKIATPDAVTALLKLRTTFAGAGLLQAGSELSQNGDVSAARQVLTKLAANGTPSHIQRGANVMLASPDENRSGFKPLFNGRDLADWVVDTPGIWSVRNGVIVGRSPGLKYNEFLRTKKHYENFVLRGKLRLIDGVGNSGFQFRSEPVPNSHEVSGYQADAGEQFWGNLYDESRRKKALATPPDTFLKQLDPTAWHSYVVTAQGNRIQIDVDGFRTIDYEEREPGIARTGFIALQVHGGPLPSEVWFRELQIRPRTGTTDFSL